MRPPSSVMFLEGVGIEHTIADEEMGIGRKEHEVPAESQSHVMGYASEWEKGRFLLEENNSEWVSQPWRLLSVLRLFRLSSCE